MRAVRLEAVGELLVCSARTWTLSRMGMPWNWWPPANWPLLRVTRRLTLEEVPPALTAPPEPGEVKTMMLP